jgi:hypothetical protein
MYSFSDPVFANSIAILVLTFQKGALLIRLLIHTILVPGAGFN